MTLHKGNSCFGTAAACFRCYCFAAALRLLLLLLLLLLRT